LSERRFPVEIEQTIIERALVDAATIAGLAPSIHNTQPWRWRIHGTTADLFAEPARQLRIGDFDRRLLITSCGAALHHAGIALAARGYAAEVDRTPDPANEEHLARVTVTGTVAVTTAAMRLLQSVKVRRTDRRPLLDMPLPADVIDRLRHAAASFQIGLAALDRDQTIELAAATARAQRDETEDITALVELSAWSGVHRPGGAGVPDENIPDRPVQTTVPARDFGHVGTLPVSDAHDNAATYAILYGLEDVPAAWIRAGEALSAVWLTAIERDVAVLPMSAAVESPATRLELRRILSGIGYPYLALRLGVADPDVPPPPRTPRLPAASTIDVFD
jgi:nitroreductase